jgi:glycosyltransferase involved in cell wall biosynthesis
MGKNKISVCILSESYYPNLDGGAIFSKSLAEKLFKRGIDVFVVTRRDFASYKVSEKINGVSIIRVPLQKKSGISGTLCRYLSIFYAAVPLIGKRNRYTIILVSSLRILGITGVIISKIFKKKCILRTDSCGEFSGDYATQYLELSKFKRKLIQFYFDLRNSILLRADVFISISTPIYKEFLKSGIKEKKIHKITNGIDTSIYKSVDPFDKKELRKKLELPSDKIILLYTGRLTREKGLIFLLKGWKRLTSEFNNIHLLLIGSGEGLTLNCERELKSYVSLNNLQPSVTFTGRVYNVYEYLQCSDIFLLLSKTEALPLSLIEALACGISAVSTKVGGIPDVIIDNVNGKLVDYYDVDKLCLAIKELLIDEEKRKRLGIEGKKTIIKKYSISQVAQQYILLFNSLVKYTS